MTVEKLYTGTYLHGTSFQGTKARKGDRDNQRYLTKAIYIRTIRTYMYDENKTLSEERKGKKERKKAEERGG